MGNDQKREGGESRGKASKDGEKRSNIELKLRNCVFCYHHNNMDDAVDIHHAIEKSRPEHS